MKTGEKKHLKPKKASREIRKNKSLTVQLSKDAYDLLMHEKTLSGGTFSEIIDGLVKGEKIPNIDINEQNGGSPCRQQKI